MTERRRWLIVSWGFLLAVWVTFAAYRANYSVQVPSIFPPMEVIPCADYLPGDLQIERWVPKECYAVVR